MTGAAAAARPPRRSSLEALGGAAPAAAITARLVAGCWLAAAGLDLAAASAPSGPAAAPLTAIGLTSLLLLLPGYALGRRVRRARGAARLLATEPLGWGLVAAVGLAVPGALHDGGWRLLAWVAASAIAAGVGAGGLTEPRPRETAAGIVAGVALGLWAGQVAFGPLARRWPTPDALALVLGGTRSGDERLAAAAAAERVRLRTFDPGPPVVAVVDVTSGDETIRLLTVGGRLHGAAPTTWAGPRRVLAASVVAAALPFLVGADPVDALDVVGLGTGVACGVALSSLGPEGRLRLYEPVEGVLAAHLEVGDPFGFLSGRPLADARVERFASATPARPRAGVVVVSRPFTPAAARALAGAACVAWVTPRAPVAALRALGERPVHVLQPAPDTMVLLIGPERLDLVRWRAGWERSPGVANALHSVGLGSPLELLTTAVAGPATVRAAALAAEEADAPALDGAALAARDAGAVVATLHAGEADEDAAATLAELALRMARRQNPAAAACAAAAVARRPGPETLVAQARVLAAAGQGSAAEEAARRAVELAPDAVEPRLALAELLADRKAWEDGRRALRPAVGRDPGRDPEVHLLLGKLALGARAPGLAIRHLKAAGEHAEAGDLLAVARLLRTELGQSAREQVEEALRAADLLLRRARSTGAEERAERLADAVASLIPLSEADDLDDEQRVALARLLRRAAALESPARRAPLERRAAEALDPLAEDPAWGRERGEALLAAGDAPGAAAALARLADGAGRGDPEVLRLLGEALLAQGQDEAALGPLRRSLGMGPASSLQTRTYLAIAEAERRAGRLGGAIEALQTAERRFPGHPRVRVNLGTLLLQAGREGDALEAYRGYLQVAPRGDPIRAQVEQAVRRLEAGSR